MQFLVLLTVTLLGAASAQYSTLSARPSSNSQPVGGPAPADAVQKATQLFQRLYSEAAARAEAARDDTLQAAVPRFQSSTSPPQPVQLTPAVTPTATNVYSTVRGPVGGSAPLNAVKEATEQFQRLYAEAAARAEAATDDTEFTVPRSQPAAAPSQSVRLTPEVAAATAAFQKQNRQLAELADSAPDTHQYRAVPQQYQRVPQQVRPVYQQVRPVYQQFVHQQAARDNHLRGPPEAVQDTPEVAEAKAVFLREFQRQAELASKAGSDQYVPRYN